MNIVVCRTGSRTAEGRRGALVNNIDGMGGQRT